MRLVSWNCNKKFREKFNYISKYNADLYIIQECENPNNFKNTPYGEWAKNSLWIGENPNSGLGIFGNSEIAISKLDWENHFLNYFLPCRINNTFDLLGVWASKPYIEAMVVYLSFNYHNINDKTIILGDFNSNVIWDKQHNIRSHSTLNKLMSEKGLVSAYHHYLNSDFGKEKDPTFYLHKNVNKPYHIDYCYCKPEIIENFQIDIFGDWDTNKKLLGFISDHVPIIIDVDV